MAGPIQNIEAAFESLVESDETLGSAFVVYSGINNEDKESQCIVCSVADLQSTEEQTGYFSADVNISLRYPISGETGAFDTYCGALHDLLSYQDNEGLGDTINALDDVSVYCPGAWIVGESHEYAEDHWRYTVTVRAYFAPDA